MTMVKAYDIQGVYPRLYCSLSVGENSLINKDASHSSAEVKNMISRSTRNEGTYPNDINILNFVTSSLLSGIVSHQIY